METSPETNPETIALTDAEREQIERLRQQQADLAAAQAGELDEDFDAFWREQEAAGQRKGRRVKIMGRVVTLPPALPLQFELEARKLARSRDERDVHKLVGILFGTEAYDAWAEAGMDLEQFQMVLSWAPRAIAGMPITLAEVAAEMQAAKAKRADQGDQEDGEDSDPS